MDSIRPPRRYGNTWLRWSLGQPGSPQSFFEIARDLRHADKLELSATTFVFNHNSDGNILVGGDNDLGFRTKAQIAKLMACR